ncbi:MAG: hypothetical protein ACTSRK_21550 [Promethearchaeota archaeon]
MFDPAIFSRIQAAKLAVQQGKEATPQPLFHTMDEIRSYLLRIESYLGNSSKFWSSERFKLAEFRRLSIWLIKGIPGYKKVRAILSRMNNFDHLREYVFSNQISADFIQGQKKIE